MLPIFDGAGSAKMVSARKTLSLARSVWAALLSVSVSSASAATISLAPIGNDPAQSVVLVEGTLLPSDGTEFRSRVGSLTKAIVTFNSDGGSLLAGIEIGKTIRLKSFATVVLDGERCASACAFAWLGGSPRFMGTDSFVGFHAAYVEREGRPTETGVGNALLGSYLTQIGLSESAVVYITKAAPTEMTWLNFRDAEQIGIDVIPWESRSSHLRSRPNLRGRPDPTAEDLATRARSFVTAIQSRWSDANSAGLGWLDSLYANEVDYYGKRLSRDAVLADKRRFAERWPERTYRIQANSMMAQCSASDCVVTGNIEWEARSPVRNAASNGTATFAYALMVSARQIFHQRRKRGGNPAANFAVGPVEVMRVIAPLDLSCRDCKCCPYR